MRINNRIALAATIAVAVLIVNAPANAQTLIYDNGINTGNGNANFISDIPAISVIGETFTLATGATINQVQFLGLYGNGNSPTATTDNFTITFHNTTAGVPNTNPFAGGTFAIGSPGRTDTGINLGALDIYSYVVNLSSAVTVNAGTYGISIMNDTTADTNDTWRWLTRTGSGQYFFRNTPSQSWGTTTGELAFSLYNTTSAAAPEPTTFALLAVGIVGFVAKRRRAN